MPFETVPDDLVALRFPIGEDEEEIKRIALPDEQSTIGPAFREGNWIASAIANGDKRYQPEPKYSPLNDIADTPYLWDYGDEFVGAQSSAEVRDIKARIDRREKDREIIKSGGWYGTIAGFGAGLIDPLNLAPGGAIVKGMKTGAGVKSAISVGRAAGAVTAVQEGLLHASQDDRTLGASIFNIGTATIIGGVLGGSASKFLSAAERKAAIDAFDTHVKGPAKGTPTPTSPDTSAGAAATDTRVLEPQDMGTVGAGLGKAREALERVPVVGKPLAKVLGAPAALVRNIGPTNRVAYGEFNEARRAMFDLAESPGILFKENLEGGSTVQGGGPAIETHARMAILGGRYRMQQEMDAHWKEYYWGNEKEQFGQLKAKVRELTGKVEGERLSFEAFKTEVARAMRRGDEHEIPQVAQAAKQLRKDIFDPWKQMAIDTKLLPEDVSVDETAMSYLMRVYDHEKIIQDRPRFEGRITEWLTGNQTHNARLKESLQTSLKERKAKEIELRKIENKSDPESLAARAILEQEITALRTKSEADLKAWKGKSSAEALMDIAEREAAEQQRTLDADPLSKDTGSWRDETVVVTADGKPAMVKAGAAVDMLISRMKAVNNLLECIRAG